ncbi:MAG: crotonase/enoyl-CoA hydratase family protein [Mesorhizobium sp.]|uniref:crotonase/enoyl-CoA hydratase family protein n=11 Tax=Mesorhizobium TaxID=68287 RepID=UPI000FCAC53F|nr:MULTISPECIES: crotonase/enoyl-CoA hydratase family protein [unclassified Mesorhizobium]RVD67979.1 crotonase/enoyl-CoA hydratase family protein [Mesorhizobium sp. M4A.F.Ca.ET.029.04.2.1]RWD01097.1 MAG: crotonase/enoyl-CoA hydratase family protein [Mesorhizobium sp.]RVC46723.1 crotonase/enoyl-CoA hydratase family protein [Mesorhizobium sp. M4A.F.Ca.ET.090.04.2.1]RVD44339.1 crotonase/enoyl-CoA hydratase family protein [Mesorhizobium sp. M4A.F.Ca.ET.020.02.1.1]RWD13120.1 MAG: crotonase/enoyl-Co
MTELVLCESRDRVAVLTLNRPEKLNALNYALIDRLLDMLDRIETDDAVRAVILTGAGERAFSAGADIHEFSVSVAAGADVALRDFVMRGQRLTARLEAFRKPVIAAVNGIAFGGGCEITEAVPLAIASDRALFAKPEINLAMPPTFGGTQRLPRLAGRKRALELLLTGEAFSAARAVELGLVNRIVPQAELMPAAHDLARRIITHSQAAVASILTAVARGINLSIAEGLLVEAEQFARIVPTADLREGLDAWIERRKPAYDGSWTHITRPSEARRASLAMDRLADQGETATRPFMLGWKRQK